MATFIIHPLVGPIDGFWHLANFLAPAFGVALLTAAACKLLWRRDLAAVSWRRLALWAFLGGAGGLIAGLVVFGRDGKMASYGLLIAAASLALWWSSFRRR